MKGRCARVQASVGSFFHNHRHVSRTLTIDVDYNQLPGSSLVFGQKAQSFVSEVNVTSPPFQKERR